MFKYLSEILSKFTPSQRLFALGLLLFTAVLLGLGNTIIDSFAQSDSVLLSKVEQMKKNQLYLKNANDSLSVIIIQNQIQCSSDIVEVRRKVLEDLGILERRLMSMNNQRVMDSYEMIPHEVAVPHIEREEGTIEHMEVREIPVSIEMAQPKRRFTIGGRPPQALSRVEVIQDTILTTEVVVTEKVVWDTIVVMDSIRITPQPNSVTPMMLNEIRELQSKLKKDIQ